VAALLPPDWGSLCRNGAANERRLCHLRLGVDGDGTSGKHGADGGARHSQPGGVIAAAGRKLHSWRGSGPDRDVRREAARYALAGDDGSGACNGRDFIDDTGFPKQGTHSWRGSVQRRISGAQSARSANCQVAASLTIATRTEHVPVDFALYLPESWTEDPSRRAEAHIPDEVTFKTKPELGGRDDRACHCGRVARLAGAGRQRVWRQLRVFAGACAARVWATPSAYTRTTTVWRLDLLGRRIGDPVAVA